MWTRWAVRATSVFFVIAAGCGGGGSTMSSTSGSTATSATGSTATFASGRDIANAIHCTDYSEEQPGPVQNSEGKISGQAQAMATFVRTIGYCQLFNQDILVLKSPGAAAKLDDSLRTLCPLFSGDASSGASESLRADDWEVFLDRDRPGLGTLQKIKAAIGGSVVNVAC
jgi:hypothetical protein